MGAGEEGAGEGAGDPDVVDSTGQAPLELSPSEVESAAASRLELTSGTGSAGRLVSGGVGTELETGDGSSGTAPASGGDCRAVQYGVHQENKDKAGEATKGNRHGIAQIETEDRIDRNSRKSGMDRNRRRKNMTK